MKVEAVPDDPYCNECRRTAPGYYLEGQPEGIKSWLCIECFLGHLQNGTLHVGPEPQAKTVVDADRHQLRMLVGLAHCKTCERVTNFSLDNVPVCAMCLVERVTNGNLAIVTPREAPDVVSADASAPFEVAWE